MQRWTVVVAASLLCACSGGSHTAAPASSAPSSSPAPTTAPATTDPPAALAPPTTASPLSPIAGCPDPGPLAQPAADRPVYDVTMTVDPVQHTVTGSTTVTFRPDLATDHLVVRLWPNSPVPAAAGTHEDAGPVTDTGRQAQLTSSQPDATTLVVSLAAPLAAGESLTVSLPFTLAVPGNDDDRVASDDDTMRLGSIVPTLAWEPGVGWATERPTSIHGEAATSPAADYTVRVAVPAGYDVLGTGEQDGSGTWHATAVRDVAFSIGHFAVAEADVAGVHVVVGVDRSIDEDPARQLRLITDALPHYESRFGAFPWKTYTVATTPGFHGGIEFPLHVMQAPGSADRSIVHELAHQWFYSLVGNDQARDPWLDEGLASYAEFVQIGSLDLHSHDAIPSAVRGRAGDPMTFWDDHGGAYYAGLYVQAAEAVASLGTVDQVDCALRQYVAHNAFRIATPADLFAALDTVFPDAPAELAPSGLHP